MGARSAQPRERVAGALSRGARGRGLSSGRDLAHDFDDVAVRVPDAELTVGAVAAREDVANAFELALGAELARVRFDIAA